MRPTSLKEVARQSGSLAEFGGNLRDWLHEMRRLSSRPQLQRAVAEEPAFLKDRFTQGQMADAWLAAYAEYLSSRIKCPPPAWSFKASRIAKVPWFHDSVSDPGLRALALARSPLAFKRRNLYTPDVDLPLRLNAGRPRKSAVEKRASNSERQRRFRERQRDELRRLRSLLRPNIPSGGR
jgi:hypothetical protein